jgi:glycosyltransferase involved in cell wall biosynthesis
MSQSPGAVPRGSIGLPVRYGDKYLAAAVCSLVGQSERDTGIIVSDNGSEDSSRKFLQEQVALNSRIRYFRQEAPISAYSNFHFVLAQARVVLSPQRIGPT